MLIEEIEGPLTELQGVTMKNKKGGMWSASALCRIDDCYNYYLCRPNFWCIVYNSNFSKIKFQLMKLQNKIFNLKGNNGFYYDCKFI